MTPARTLSGFWPGQNAFHVCLYYHSYSGRLSADVLQVYVTRPVTSVLAMPVHKGMALL